MTFVQGWTSVEDVGPTLYKCHINVLFYWVTVGISKLSTNFQPWHQSARWEIVDLHFDKSENCLHTWSFESRQRDTTSRGWKFHLMKLVVIGLILILRIYFAGQRQAALNRRPIQASLFRESCSGSNRLGIHTWTTHNPPPPHPEACRSSNSHVCIDLLEIWNEILSPVLG